MRNQPKGWRPFFRKKPTEGTTRKSHVPFRLDFLFFIVFILFSALIIRLADLQINKQAEYQQIISEGSSNQIKEPSLRGSIYDLSGKLLVGSKANPSITFTRSNNMTAKELLDIANQINDLVDIPKDDLTERDKKDYWLAEPKNYEAAEKRLSDKEKLDKKGNLLSNGDYYAQVVGKVKQEEIQFDDNTLKAASIFKKINGTVAMGTVTLKNKDVTTEEIALVGENTATIPGLSTSTDWERDYPEEDMIQNLFGTVSSESAGLPKEQLDKYLEKGYERNDRVGTSYLEESYEDVLQGKKTVYEVNTDNKGRIISKTEVQAGQKGDNLKLTIDLDFQRRVEEILRSNYQVLINNGKARYSPGAYVVVTNPETGAVYALAGLKHDTETGELTDDVLGTFTNAFEPGSAIKAATVMSGYENGIIKGNATLVDEPIRIAGSAPKTSVFNPYGQVAINTTTALEVSSNVYMMKIAMGMMGIEYRDGMTLPARTDVFETLRDTYAQFGLGSATGLDLPGESTGYANKQYTDEDGNLISGIMGNLLDLSYGNYDLYTPLQMAQYIATVANNGVRVAPHVVEGVYGNDEKGNLGELKEKVEPKVKSKIEGRQSEFDIIQQGLYQVVYGGSGTGRALQGSNYTVAAKTGTAETYVGNTPVVNSTLVGYAPFDNPKVAISIVLPKITDESNGLNTAIGTQIFNAFYEMMDDKVQ